LLSMSGSARWRTACPLAMLAVSRQATSAGTTCLALTRLVASDEPTGPA